MEPSQDYTDAERDKLKSGEGQYHKGLVEYYADRLEWSKAGLRAFLDKDEKESNG